MYLRKDRQGCKEAFEGGLAEDLASPSAGLGDAAGMRVIGQLSPMCACMLVSELCMAGPEAAKDSWK